MAGLVRFECSEARAAPPWGLGSCEVLATSPTATQVLQEREAWSRRACSSSRPSRWMTSRPCEETAERKAQRLVPLQAWAAASALGSCETSEVLKLFWRPRADERAPQLRISSVSSSNHSISGMSAGLTVKRFRMLAENYDFVSHCSFMKRSFDQPKLQFSDIQAILNENSRCVL